MRLHPSRTVRRDGERRGCHSPAHGHAVVRLDVVSRAGDEARGAHLPDVADVVLDARVIVREVHPRRGDAQRPSPHHHALQPAVHAFHRKSSLPHGAGPVQRAAHVTNDSVAPASLPAGSPGAARAASGHKTPLPFVSAHEAAMPTDCGQPLRGSFGALPSQATPGSSRDGRHVHVPHFSPASSRSAHSIESWTPSPSNASMQQNTRPRDRRGGLTKAQRCGGWVKQIHASSNAKSTQSYRSHSNGRTRPSFGSCTARSSCVFRAPDVVCASAHHRLPMRIVNQCVTFNAARFALLSRPGSEAPRLTTGVSSDEGPLRDQGRWRIA